MAYKKEDLIKQALQAIKEHKLIFIEEVVSFLPCSVSTFYNKGIQKIPKINKALNNNNIVSKSELKKVYDCDNKFKKGSGYVYIVHCKGSDLYKIGISKSKPNNRLSNLQSGCPFELDMIHIGLCDHYGLLESEIHKRYSKHRVRGEWFKLSAPLLLCVLNDIDKESMKQLKLF